MWRNAEHRGPRRDRRWGRIELGGTSTANVLSYVQVRYGGVYSSGAVVVNGGDLTLSNSTVRNSAGVGMRIIGANPVLNANTFQDNTAGAALSMDLASNPDITGVTLADNGLNGLAVDNGTMTNGGTWDDPDITYWLNDDITVPAGQALTIAPGQVIKPSWYYEANLLINGILNAAGTSGSPIIFTSEADVSLFVPSAAPGVWYIMVCAAYHTGNGNYSLQVEASQVELTQVVPAALGNAAPMTLTLTGAGFVAGTTVDLVAGDQTAYPAAVEVDSFTQITATYAAGGGGGLVAGLVRRLERAYREAWASWVRPGSHH